MNTKISLLYILLCLPILSFSQKIGYVNSQEILDKMTEVKIANIQLDAYEKELTAKGEEMVLKFENQYKLYMKEVNSGTLSKVQMATKEQDLMAKQEEIRNFETEADELMEKKRQSLFEPILLKINDEIKKLGQEKGYTLILDSAQGLLLHATEADNLIDDLKSKLGIPE